jgi:hypothetical protein
MRNVFSGRAGVKVCSRLLPPVHRGPVSENRTWPNQPFRRTTPDLIDYQGGLLRPPRPPPQRGDRVLPSRQAAERELAEILADEPDWVAKLEIVIVDFSGAEPAVASISTA